MAIEEQIRPQLGQLNIIFDECVADGDVRAALIKALASITALEQVLNAVSRKEEYVLYIQALQEVQYSLLSVSIGSYRHAYSSLRLFFELCLAGIEFSSNLRYFKSWTLGREDIFWARLSDADSGVMSKNFCTLFFSELADEAPHFRSLATTVYRECSEFVHGNPKAISTLPETLQFKKETALDWSNKLDTMCLVVIFTFSVRYLTELSSEAREDVKDSILAQIEHLEPIRQIFGGVAGG